MIGLFPPGNYYAGATGAPANTNRYVNLTDPRDQSIFNRFIQGYTPIVNEQAGTGIHTAGLYYQNGKLSGMQTVGKENAVMAFTGGMTAGQGERIWDMLDPYIHNTPEAITGPDIMTPDEQQAAADEKYNKENLYILIGGMAAAAIIIISSKKKKRR